MMSKENTTMGSGSVNFSGGRKKFLIFAVLLLMTTGIAANYGGAVLLPSKMVELGTMDYYAVCSALSSMGMMLALPLVGVLGSKFGVKAVTLFGVMLQLVSRIALMFITNFFVFAIFWSLTGIGAGLYASAPYAIMADIVSSEERPKYYGLLATFSAIGAILGPVLTGAVVDNISTNMALIAYIIFGIIPFVGLSLFYPNKKRPSTGKFDFIGIILLVIAVASIVLWLSLGGKFFEFFSPIGILIIAIGIISLIMLVKVESVNDNPSVPIHFFKVSRFKTTFVIQMLLVSYSTCVAAFGIVYIQQVMQGSSLVSSTITLPQTIVQALLGIFVGSYVGKNFRKRFRPIALLALACYTVALLIFTTLQPNSSMVIIYFATALGGFGQAVSQSTFAPFFQTQIKPEEFSAAQGMYQFSSTSGATIFTAVCGAALNLGFNYNQIFLLGTILCGLALLIGVIGFRFPKEEIASESI